MSDLTPAARDNDSTMIDALRACGFFVRTKFLVTDQRPQVVGTIDNAMKFSKLTHTLLAAELAGEFGQPDRGRNAALLSAIRHGVPLEEPVSVAKAMMAQEKARVSLSGGTGPLAGVFVVNIQVQPWTHSKETATAYADGFNRGVDWLRSSIIEYADKLPPANVAPVGKLSEVEDDTP